MTQKVVHGAEPVVCTSGTTVQERMASIGFERGRCNFEYVFDADRVDELLIPAVGEGAARNRDANSRTCSALGQAVEYRIGLRLQLLVRGYDKSCIRPAPSIVEVRSDLVRDRDVDAKRRRKARRATIAAFGYNGGRSRHNGPLAGAALRVSM
jgi:hypothetical protein